MEMEAAEAEQVALWVGERLGHEAVPVKLKALQLCALWGSHLLLCCAPALFHEVDAPQLTWAAVLTGLLCLTGSSTSAART